MPTLSTTNTTTTSSPTMTYTSSSNTTSSFTATSKKEKYLKERATVTVTSCPKGSEVYSVCTTCFQNPITIKPDPTKGITIVENEMHGITPAPAVLSLPTVEEKTATSSTTPMTPVRTDSGLPSTTLETALTQSANAMSKPAFIFTLPTTSEIVSTSSTKMVTSTVSPVQSSTTTSQVPTAVSAATTHPSNTVTIISTMIPTTPATIRVYRSRTKKTVNNTESKSTLLSSPDVITITTTLKKSRRPRTKKETIGSINDTNIVLIHSTATVTEASNTFTNIITHTASTSSSVTVRVPRSKTCTVVTSCDNSQTATETKLETVTNTNTVRS